MDSPKSLVRPVQFGGAITLKPSLRPRIVVEEFVIGNPDWTTSPHLAKVDKVEVQIALPPLRVPTHAEIAVVPEEAVELIGEVACNLHHGRTVGVGRRD